MRPAFGAISPPSWPISVVLPAPFGPMMACSSPLVTSSCTPSEAMTPPKRLGRPYMRRRECATAQPHQDAVDAAARIERDSEQHRAEDDPLEFGEARHHLLQEQECARHCHPDAP